MRYDNKISFPKNRIYSNNKKCNIKHNNTIDNEFNTKIYLLQTYLDNQVITALQEYVSFKTGTQMKSIPISSVAGTGLVHINVPYATYQAYSKKIKKRVGKRGTQPFERMVQDCKNIWLNRLIEYSKKGE